ncbi:MAG: class I SAM-dependent methyltransferase [Vicinamibacterales bacterium]
MTACPVCAALSPAPFLIRDPVPVHQNLVVGDVASAVALNRGRLALHACDACGFVFNAAFDPALLSYGAAYDNTQSCSPAFEQYLQQLADHVVHERGVRSSRIVEIGCGKGAFLRALVERDPDNTGVGFDPSYVGPESAAGGRVRFERRFYDRTCTELQADAVVCRHVLEHIADPVALLRVVRDTLSASSATVFFETPCVEWILSNAVIWDFFYEHCSYFTAGSLSTAFERAGFSVTGIRHTFGGQYLWIEARPAETPVRHDRDASGIPDLARHFAESEATHVTALRRRIEALASQGPVAMWGAAGKGVTLANLADPERRLIACIVDLNPNKQGGFLPGTGHRIVAPEDLPHWNVKNAIMTNPNYLEENARLLRDASLEVRLIDLMQPGEVDAHSY